MDIIRRIRAMLRTAVVWSAAWTVPGLVWTCVGAISGAAFALTLSVAERRRSSLGTLSMRRVVSWGAIGGAALPLVVLPLLPIVAPELAGQFPAVQNLSAALRQGLLAASVYGLLGAVSAGASLQLARRVDPGLRSRAGDLSAVPPATS
jgi:hypothetical protein